MHPHGTSRRHGVVARPANLIEWLQDGLTGCDRPANVPCSVWSPPPPCGRWTRPGVHSGRYWRRALDELVVVVSPHRSAMFDVCRRRTWWRRLVRRRREFAEAIARRRLRIAAAPVGTVRVPAPKPTPGPARGLAWFRNGDEVFSPGLRRAPSRMEGKRGSPAAMRSRRR